MTEKPPIQDSPLGAGNPRFPDTWIKWFVFISNTLSAISGKSRSTSDTTINNTAYHWLGNTDGGGFTYILPAGTDGEQYRIVNIGTSGNTLTITPNGSEKLLGVNSSDTLSDGESLVIVYDNIDGWW